MITDAYFTAFILGPSILVFNSNQEKEEEKKMILQKMDKKRKKGMKFIKEKYSSCFLAITLKILRKLQPFQNENIFFLTRQLLKQFLIMSTGIGFLKFKMGM